MIDNDKDGKLTPADKDRQKGDIQEVASYCFNKGDCRRVTVLRHFGEEFDSIDCQNSCDNCIFNAGGVPKDLTDVAIHAINYVKSVLDDDAAALLTLRRAAEGFHGSKSQAVLKLGLEKKPLAGRGEICGLERNEVERLFNHLLGEQALRLELVENQQGWNNPYLRVGSSP